MTVAPLGERITEDCARLSAAYFAALAPALREASAAIEARRPSIEAACQQAGARCLQLLAAAHGTLTQRSVMSKPYRA